MLDIRKDKTMKRKLLLIILVLATTTLLCCGPDRPSLHIFNWAEYIDPQVVRDFEQQYNCQVVIDSFDSNEAMYAKIKAGASGYDVIFPTTYMVTVMNQQKMLQPLDHKLLPNLQQIDREILKFTSIDNTMVYSVPYMTSVTGIGYNKSRIKDWQSSWAMFDRKDLAGRMTLLNDMRETIGAALKFLGYSLNTTDEKQLTEARDVAIRWKKNIAKFAVEEAKVGLGSNEFLMSHYYNGDVRQITKDNPNIVFALPKEGFAVNSDDMVIPKGAHQVKLAHQFINFLLEPKNAAANMKFLNYFSPNKGARAILGEEFFNTPALALNAKILAKGEVIRDVGKDIVKYTKVWDEIKGSE